MRRLISGRLRKPDVRSPGSTPNQASGCASSGPSQNCKATRQHMCRCYRKPALVGFCVRSCRSPADWHAVDYLADCSALAHHARRVTVKPSDSRLLKHLLRQRIGVVYRQPSRTFKQTLCCVGSSAFVGFRVLQHDFSVSLF